MQSDAAVHDPLVDRDGVSIHTLRCRDDDGRESSLIVTSFSISTGGSEIIGSRTRSAKVMTVAKRSRARRP